MDDNWKNNNDSEQKMEEQKMELLKFCRMCGAPSSSFVYLEGRNEFMCPDCGAKYDSDAYFW